MPIAGLVAKVRDGQGKLKFGGIPHPQYDFLPAEAVQASIQFILDGKYVNDKDAPAAVDLSKMPAEEWMKSRSDCFTCHSVASKIVGPAYKDVAKKYAGATDAQVKVLVKKVKNGRLRQLGLGPHGGSSLGSRRHAGKGRALGPLTEVGLTWNTALSAGSAASWP